MLCSTIYIFLLFASLALNLLLFDFFLVDDETELALEVDLILFIDEALDYIDRTDDLDELLTDLFYLEMFDLLDILD